MLVHDGEDGARRMGKCWRLPGRGGLRRAARARRLEGRKGFGEEGSARSTWEPRRGRWGHAGWLGLGAGCQKGLTRRSLVSRAAETWRRLACPGPAFRGELPLPRGTGPCRLQWGRTCLSRVSRGWVCLHWVWHLSRFVTQNQTRSWTTFTCCMKAKLCWKTNPAKNQSW